MGLPAGNLALRGKWMWQWENFSGLAEHGNESCSSQAAVQGDGELLKQIDLKNANNSAFEESFKKT